MLQRLAHAGLVKGKTVGIDATTLEANAALRSIVRRDTGESYQDFLTKLAQASGIETPTRADRARMDRQRKKKGSNDDWMHPHDPDAKITKMKDGRTHLAHKAEHAVDLETGAIVGITVQDADEGDTTTSIETLKRHGWLMLVVGGGVVAGALGMWCFYGALNASSNLGVTLAVAFACSPAGRDGGWPAAARSAARPSYGLRHGRHHHWHHRRATRAQSPAVGALKGEWHCGLGFGLRLGFGHWAPALASHAAHSMS
jgi:hypothetical protein